MQRVVGGSLYVNGRVGVLPVGHVDVVLQVEGDIKKVCNLPPCFNCVLQVESVEHLHDLFAQSVQAWSREVGYGEAVVPVEANQLLLEQFL